jgi:hypothetical protein
MPRQSSATPRPGAFPCSTCARTEASCRRATPRGLRSSTRRTVPAPAPGPGGWRVGGMRR